MSTPPPALDPQRSPSERFARIVTNLIRLAGGIVVMHEVFGEPTIRTPAIAIAALMLAGSDGLETFLASFFGTKD